MPNQDRQHDASSKRRLAEALARVLMSQRTKEASRGVLLNQAVLAQSGQPIQAMPTGDHKLQAALPQHRLLDEELKAGRYHQQPFIDARSLYFSPVPLAEMQPLFDPQLGEYAQGRRRAQFDDLWRSAPNVQPGTRYPLNHGVINPVTENELRYSPVPIAQMQASSRPLTAVSAITEGRRARTRFDDFWEMVPRSE